MEKPINRYEAMLRYYTDIANGEKDKAEKELAEWKSLRAEYKEEKEKHGVMVILD